MGIRDFYPDEQITQDMQLLTQMQMADDIHAMRHGVKSAATNGRATTGWRNRGFFFWVILITILSWQAFKLVCWIW
jgi:hypothetical protein